MTKQVTITMDERAAARLLSFLDAMGEEGADVHGAAQDDNDGSPESEAALFELEHEIAAWNQTILALRDGGGTITDADVEAEAEEIRSLRQDD